MGQEHILVSNILSYFKVLSQVKNIQYILLGIIYLFKNNIINLYIFLHIYVYIKVIISCNQLLQKNGFIISSIIKRAMRLKSVNKETMGPVKKLKTKLATKLATELKNKKKFPIELAIELAGIKEILLSPINICHNY